MKKAYIFYIILVLFLAVFSLASHQVSLGAGFFEKFSILDKNYSSEFIGDAENIVMPKLKKIVEEPKIVANSYLVLDRDTQTPLIYENQNKRFYIGSLTKLMTAVITLDNSNLDDVVEIGSDFDNIPNYKIGLKKGEQITVENLLYGALIPSGNDAAEALAQYTGRGDYWGFISMMNDKAKVLGMHNTSFSNSMGLDSTDNYSTANDIALLANYALNNDFIRRVVEIKEKEIASVDGLIKYQLTTTNQLLLNNEVGVFGMKTGRTPWAGECLLTVAQNRSNKEIITVVLGSEARFDDSRTLIQWVWDNIIWK